VHGTLVWGGVGVALVTLIFGMVILFVTLLLWFGLRQWVRWHSAPHQRPPPLS
jgi:uncharacterized membrane protein